MNIKYGLLNVALAVLAVLCVVGIVLAGYDAPPRPRATPDLLEYMIKTPADVYEKYGYSERTDILFNLTLFKKLYIDYAESAKQIQMLKGRVKLLEDKLVPMVPAVPAADVNSVK